MIERRIEESLQGLILFVTATYILERRTAMNKTNDKPMKFICPMCTHEQEIKPGEAIWSPGMRMWLWTCANCNSTIHSNFITEKTIEEIIKKPKKKKPETDKEKIKRLECENRRLKKKLKEKEEYISDSIRWDGWDGGGGF